jgi:acyl-coenzyme A synthetase/AMP-(fatty) acid ligase
LIVATLPMTPSGKIAKSDLAKIAEDMRPESRPVALG